MEKRKRRPAEKPEREGPRRADREPAGGDSTLWGSVFEGVLNPQEVFKVFEDIGLKKAEGADHDE